MSQKKKKIDFSFSNFGRNIKSFLFIYNKYYTNKRSDLLVLHENGYGVESN